MSIRKLTPAQLWQRSERKDECPECGRPLSVPFRVKFGPDAGTLVSRCTYKRCDYTMNVSALLAGRTGVDA